MKRSRYFDYQCARCRKVVELLVEYEERDDDRRHTDVSRSRCQGFLKRGWHSSKSPAKVQEGYQMKAVMYRGEQSVGHVTGNFGKDSPKRRKRF